MAQSYMLPSAIAREVLWTYWVDSGTSADKTFYVALQDIVASELARRTQGTRLWVGREIQLTVASYTIRARLTNINPLLATTIADTTICQAEYRERSKEEGQDISHFISEVIRYPNKRLGYMYEALIGIDPIKQDMLRKLHLLLRPNEIRDWFEANYGTEPTPMLKGALFERYPLIILQGEVGSGKTALARSIGHPLSQHDFLNSSIVLYVVNAQIRGGGHVGELTQNISRAFDEVERCHEQEQLPVLVFIDEADALAQARGTNQTHHEDDAGVNTLIQRIDRLRGRPVAVIFATNLVKSLDNAILRRASAIYSFDRPTLKQRLEVFKALLSPLGVDDTGVNRLAHATKARPIVEGSQEVHRYTYSDLTQRLIPYAIEAAVAAKDRLRPKHLHSAHEEILPTPEMNRHSPENLILYSPTDKVAPQQGVQEDTAPSPNRRVSRRFGGAKAIRRE